MALTTTETSICNSALIKLGAERINSLSETNKRARLCNEQYNKVRDEVLRAHPWNFALKRASLGTLTTTPLFEYDYEFQLPSDCLRVLSLHDNTILWAIEADRKLLSDSSEVKIKYISRVTATAEYDSQFLEALSFRLAADLSYSLVQSSALSQKLLAEYESVLSAARSIDAQEGTPPDLIDDSFVESRL